MDRIIERLAGKKCRVTNPIDKSLVGALMAIPPQQRTDEDKRKITQIFEENDKFNQCHFSVEIDWSNELHRRLKMTSPVQRLRQTSSLTRPILRTSCARRHLTRIRHSLVPFEHNAELRGASQPKHLSIVSVWLGHPSASAQCVRGIGVMDQVA